MLYIMVFTATSPVVASMAMSFIITFLKKYKTFYSGNFVRTSLTSPNFCSFFFVSCCFQGSGNPVSMQNTLQKLEWARIDAGYSPLHVASEDGRTEDVVNMLVSSEGKGTDDFQGGGKTALMLAAREGHAHVARELLKHGADIDKRSDKCKRKTALHFAAGCGQDEVVVVLVMRGADVDCQMGDRSTGRRTALELAAEGGHLRVVNTLVLRGAIVYPDTIGRLRFGTEEEFRAAFNKVFDGNIESGHKSHGDFLQSALLYAAEYGNLPVVKALSTKGVDLDGTAEYYPSHSDIVPGQATALHAAASGGHNDVVNYLLDNSVRIDPDDKNMMTPLMWSAMKNHLCVSATLLEAGANASAEDQMGESSLSSDSWSCSVDMALLLLRYGADVNASGGLFGSSALHNAIKNRDNTEAMVDLLLRWGADETVVDDRGRTPLDVFTSGTRFQRTAETKERVRKLLVNAPADRTWRRRGWLVMLWERERRKTVKEGCKLARTEEDIVVGGVATWLFAVTDEGVLRTVVAFL
ncbi:unnamed protein product [Ectocarpus sp. 4 AP-2014]|uniref:EsV-1-21 n=1 Tax=Ectocarpus siliculosus virus 1 (isolate New Zealand/Kaikoura/1988) TaxID=654926 RepID=Q8QNP0_ESV1K|nr:EsV-1-21 [Ectocarpus siliculosus virus 1]AAK14447.1 EsV-1-21 [Ectocarpus siliculosus virus 1]